MERVRTAVVSASGTANVLFNDVPAGREWIIPQIAVQVSTGGVLVTSSGIFCSIKRNGLLIASTKQGGRAVASGQPYYALMPTDSLSIDWSGATAGYLAQAVIYFTEVESGASRRNIGVI